MKVIKSVLETQQICREIAYSGKTIGLVPTMGFLHDGHLSLIDISRQKSDFTVVTVFVNPIQFGPAEDLDSYPRDFEKDQNKCEQLGVDLIFYPETQQIYPRDFKTYVSTENISKILCGKSRPDHFRGVTTVVAKLFNIVRPHIAVFGQKDAQQAVIIRQMVKDLNFDIKIILGPIKREKDGLAMSSRNKYLDAQERSDATVINKALKRAQEQFSDGEQNADLLIKKIREMILQKNTAKIDYIEAVDKNSLATVHKLSTDTMIAVAVFIGKTRLIDNIILSST